jgi:hypothetical protein
VLLLQLLVFLLLLLLPLLLLLMLLFLLLLLLVPSATLNDGHPGFGITQMLKCKKPYTGNICLLN